MGGMPTSHHGLWLGNLAGSDLEGNGTYTNSLSRSKLSACLLREQRVDCWTNTQGHKCKQAHGTEESAGSDIWRQRWHSSSPTFQLVIRLDASACSPCSVVQDLTSKDHLPRTPPLSVFRLCLAKRHHWEEIGIEDKVSSPSHWHGL